MIREQSIRLTFEYAAGVAAECEKKIVVRREPIE